MTLIYIFSIILFKLIIIQYLCYIDIVYAYTVLASISLERVFKNDLVS